MKRGKRVKPVFPVEYRLLISSQYDESDKQTAISFKLRTISEFTSFSYEIIVEHELQDRTIKLNIRGIRAPQLSIPSSGPAYFKTVYPDLSGRYDLIVSKPGKSDNLYSINITKKQIIIEKRPKKIFVDVITSDSDW